MRRAPVACITLCAALASCTPAVTETPTTSTTTTSLTPTSSVASTTSSTPASTTSTTVFPPSEFECPPVLVVAGELTKVGPDCSTTSLTFNDSEFDTAMPRVMDDMAGGLIYQTDQSAIFWLETGQDRAVVVASVDDAEAESVTIEDVVVIDGAVELWFTRWRGLDWEDFDDIDDVLQTLERRVIDVGQTTEVALIGAWESGSSVTVGGETVGIENWAEGFYYFAVNNLEMELLPQAWSPYDPAEPKDVVCDGCPTGLVISDDGSRAVFLAPEPQEAMILPELVVIDLGSGEELARLQISGFGWPLGSPAEGPEITTIDILGDLVLVNGADEGQMFPSVWTDLAAEEPVWEELPVPGSARFLRSDIRFDQLEATGLP